MAIAELIAHENVYPVLYVCRLLSRALVRPLGFLSAAGDDGVLSDE